MLKFAQRLLRGPDLKTRDDVCANAIYESRMGWLRLPLMIVSLVALADTFSLEGAITWGVMCAGIEIANRIACELTVRRKPQAAEAFTASSFAVSIVWTMLGLLLWTTGAAEGEIAALATLAVIVVYACAFSHHSMRMLALLVTPPLMTMTGLLLAAAFSAPSGAPALMLVIIAMSTALVVVCAGATSHLSYVQVWEARDALAGERDALEVRVMERTAELASAMERAEAANVAKSHFLANMSHELRTPLNAVIGYAEMMDEDLEAEGLDSLRADAQRIRNSGRHLLKLVNDVLDLSKIEANHIELDCEFNDVGRVLRDISDSLRLAADERGNRIDVRVEPGLGPVWADGLRLHQCVLNLVSNACKFTQNGLISVSAETLNDAQGPWLAVRVRDTGIGISADQVEKLFKPFVQADVTTTRKFGGTGLGLSITRQLARAMGGDVTVESVIDAGSTFTLMLPLKTAEQVAEADKVATPVRAATSKPAAA